MTPLSLTFKGNGIGSVGAKAIGEALKTNSTLTEVSLNIMHHPLFFSNSFIFLDFTGNKIDEDGSKAIKEALKTNTSLTKLNLEGLCYCTIRVTHTT